MCVMCISSVWRWSANKGWDEAIEEPKALEDMCDPGDLQAEEHQERRTVKEEEEDWRPVAKWRAKEVATFHEVGVYEYVTRR